MRILVVEDHEKVARFIVKGLREERYVVDWATDGDEAVSLAASEPYDLIVLDIMLPGRDGYQVTRDLRRDGLTTPILMLTAKDEVDSKVKGLDCGADDYVTKPFAFEELLARIRALLRRGDLVADTRLKAADLMMDTATRSVRRGGRRIELTVKEFGLLEFLLRNKGRIMSRTVIIEHVWDMHFDSDTNVVDVYIRYLRRKIDEDFPIKLIHTVRGVGYVLRMP